MSRDTYYNQALGPTLQASVKQARVLMVGAGGIGCELLKNLVCSGYGEIHMVDLDTIDLSNLNRQFLFRKEHIKKPKALVAKEQASNFNPNVNIVAYHANIKDSQFDVKWFRTFKLVFNALDNLDARRHVNKMCLAADVPLIESGTTGFNGQVQVIKKGVTACYDCVAKETLKSFPVCTIRSTPSQPIHCIVWAKSYLLNEMFGQSEDESAFDHSADQDNAKEIQELKKEAEALKKIRQAVGTEEFPRLLFDKVFNSDVARLRSMEDMWKSRRPPEPLSFKLMREKAAGSMAEKEKILQAGQKVWSLEENFVVFMNSLERLSKRVIELKEAGGDQTITFDKDDEDTLDFVAASANIRCNVFGIERKSRFDIKQMAGNIIPAIATTNALVAGLCVLQAYKTLKGEWDQVKETYLAPFGTVRRMNSSRPREPEPTCPVCGVFHVTATADFSTATLNDVVESLIKTQLGFDEREFSLYKETNLLYDPEETGLLDKKLSDLGITGNTFLTVNDDDDRPFVPVVISMIESSEPTEKPVVALGLDEKVTIPLHPVQPESETNGMDFNGVVIETETPRGKKRGADGDIEETSAKRKKATIPDEGVVVIDDDSAAIVQDATGSIAITYEEENSTGDLVDVSKALKRNLESLLLEPLFA
ncbi:hypothetical protein MKZ38_010062 [Zalerion maritima]|uniref:Ubiquitin-activating enzyme E1-like n=1 Tax=Zalerion maritima TaxID=339359 RepID=A0AAD5RFV0_9PEZI|nr:hypothetical protein MKZ38_010062 [Zalerion maritima]